MGFMKRTGKIPQPYFFQMRDESTFAFAGIWDEWNLDHQSITSCAIVTTTANELLAPIHDLYALTLSRPDSLRKRRLRPSRLPSLSGAKGPRGLASPRSWNCPRNEMTPTESCNRVRCKSL